MEKFREYYLPDRRDWYSKYVSPLLAKDLTNLPAAIVITAQFDILRDEGEMYAEKLRNAGVYVKSLRVNGVLHSFCSMGRIYDQFNQTMLKIADFIQARNEGQTTP